MKLLALKLQAVRDIFLYFANPLTVIALRFGFLKFPLFLYRIHHRGQRYSMLARPTANSMADLFVLRELFIEQTYRELLPLLRTEPVRFVDVGGNLGSFSIWMSKIHGVAEGHCFEPDPTSYNLCRYNLANNGCTTIQHFQKAMGGRARSITMRVNTNRPGGNSIYGGESAQGEKAEIEVVAFADWMKGVAGDFDVLKLDCEGAEWEILDCTPPEVLRRFRVIVAEVHDDPDGRNGVDSFRSRLEGLGFETLRWDGHSLGLYLGRRRAS